MQLSPTWNWDWVHDRVVEQQLYVQTQAQVAITGRKGRASAPVARPAYQELSEAQVAFNTLCERASNVILRHLHAGASIIDAVDSVFDDQEWCETIELMSRLEAKGDRPEAAGEKLEHRFPWTALPVSPKSKDIAKRCLRALNAVHDAHARLTDAKYRFSASTPPDVQERDQLWFLGDPAVPEGLRRGMLAYRRASIALVATYPPTSGVIVQKHFAHVLRLVEFTTEAMTEYLAVLANIPDAGITIVAPDGSDLKSPTMDVVAPFREALRRDGETDVKDPA